ncbi:alpha/beta-hydrolase [Sodiomyces alkalinus F11]|uniref:Alpha/beta-hydrolase n=1 Tax=Sodiomyces alkalinus (strain CBS 110278 / VKM F-3762 / F11) TaxID=1314773 RepID=A0A3N2Q620_SODAK|nr:alpha/beta-hydrolase [Sodiomyces alkalinus F11]ROT42202.1 alpha/beta-hydrolase [Sodiomyces alkalinus F11]
MALQGDSNQDTIAFTSLYESNPTTIVLLHGATSSSLEWDFVIPHLSNYHLLVPDLPGHGRSRSLGPASIDISAVHVAQLIQAHAKGAKAHVVGLSMGGYVAQRLALDSPSLALSLFVTGASPFQGWTRWMAERPGLIYYLLSAFINWLPAPLYWYTASATGLKRHDALLADQRSNLEVQTIREVYGSILQLGFEQVRQLRVRALFVAGGRQDDVLGTTKVGEVLRNRVAEDGERQPDDGSRAVVVREALHTWDLQLPELFAQGVLAWIEERQLPEEFDTL